MTIKNNRNDNHTNLIYNNNVLTSINQMEREIHYSLRVACSIKIENYRKIVSKCSRHWKNNGINTQKTKVIEQNKNLFSNWRVMWDLLRRLAFNMWILKRHRILLFESNQLKRRTIQMARICYFSSYTIHNCRDINSEFMDNIQIFDRQFVFHSNSFENRQ